MEKLNFKINKSQKAVILESLKGEEMRLNYYLKNRRRFIKEWEEVFLDPKRFGYDPDGDPRQWDAVQKHYKELRNHEEVTKLKLIHINDLKNILK